MKRRFAALAARPEFWLLCLLAWLLLSAGRSLGTPWARAALTESLRWGVGVVLALTLGRTLRDAGQGARLAAALAGLMALAGVWSGLEPDRGGLAGPYHDHQLYGSVLLVLLPFPVALALTARDPAGRWGGLAVAAGGAACLILSETRGAWAGVLVASLVFAGGWLSRSGPRIMSGPRITVRRGGRQALIPVLLLLGVAALFWTTADAGLRDPLARRAGTLTALSADGSWQGRLADWRGAARLVAAHPLAGIGLGRYPGQQRAWTGAGRTLGPDARPSLSEEAHCFYLQTAAETGLIGLGLYLAALTAFARQILRRLGAARGRPGSRDALLIAALSMAAGQATDALASPSWQFAETSLFFWGLLGVGLAALRSGASEEALATTGAVSQRAWRYAASGLAALTLAANMLPLGLLTPVEAYNHSQSVTFTQLVIKPYTLNCPANSYCFSMTASYSDGSSQDVTLDSGTPNGTSTTYGCLMTQDGSYCSSTFGSGASRNILLISSKDHNKQLTISGRFSDVTYSKMPYSSSTETKLQHPLATTTITP